MSSPASDKNLLFGILASQLDFVTRDQLVAAMNAWVLYKSKSLGDVMVDRGVMTAERRALLDALVAEHLQQHDNDAQKSLLGLATVSAARRAIESVGDPDLAASIEALDREEPHATATYQPGPAWRYRILRPHAKGGLGEVFVALDAELGREVALKEILPRHADNPSSRRRFVFEASVTGGLEHPGIVPVYGLGAYPDGRPFYAMRFIRGDTLKEAIERFHVADGPGRDAGERNLALRQLLGRLCDVCDAVDYAHHKGVLHRDLKPGNIMLGKYGETLVVDWGFAKAVGTPEGSQATAEISERPLTPLAPGSHETLPGSTLGTPAYMSPEQAAGRLDQLNAASDVYSLGATLYHLLTGKPPLEGRDLGELLRKIERGEIPPPRRVSPGVPRALEAVCLKAMSLKQADRYPTPRAFADDIEAWRADEPVKAWKEPPLVRMRRAIRKRPGAVAGIVATLVVGVAGLVIGSILLERKNAETERERQTARAVSEFLQYDLLRQVDAHRQAKHLLELGDKSTKISDNPTIRELLDRAALALTPEKIEQKFPQQPLVQAEILATVADAYHSIGDNDKAIPLLTRSIDLLKVHKGPTHRDTLINQSNLARALQARGDYAKAVDLFEQCLTPLKAQLGPDDITCMVIQSNLATACRAAGQVDKGVSLLEDLLTREKAKLGERDSETLTTMGNLATAYRQKGQNERAFELYEAAVAGMKETLGAEHPRTLGVQNSLALAYAQSGKTAEAIALFEPALPVAMRIWGPDHAETLRLRNNLALAYANAGRPNDAIPLFETTLEGARVKLGPEHPNTLLAQGNLAKLYGRVKDYAKQEALLAGTADALRRKQPPDERAVANAVDELGLCQLRQKKFAEAEASLRESLAAFEKLSPDNWGVFDTRSMLGAAFAGQKKFADAEPLLIGGYEGMKSRRKDIPATLKGRLNDAGQRLVDMYEAWNKPAEAAKWRAEIDEPR